MSRRTPMIGGPSQTGANTARSLEREARKQRQLATSSVSKLACPKCTAVGRLRERNGKMACHTCNVQLPVDWPKLLKRAPFFKPDRPLLRPVLEALTDGLSAPVVDWLEGQIPPFPLEAPFLEQRADGQLLLFGQVRGANNRFELSVRGALRLVTEDAREATEILASRDLLPMAWVDDATRTFWQRAEYSPVWGSVCDLIAWASLREDAIRKAEVLARDALTRASLRSEVIAWRCLDADNERAPLAAVSPYKHEPERALESMGLALGLAHDTPTLLLRRVCGTPEKAARAAWPGLASV